MGKRILVSVLLVVIMMSFTQVAFGASKEDAKQNKQIKVIVAELNRIGKHMEKVDNQIKVIVKKIQSIENSSGGSGMSDEKVKMIVDEIQKNTKRIDKIEEGQKVLYKGMSQMEKGDGNTVVSAVDDSKINDINEDISNLKRDLNELRSQLSAGTVQTTGTTYEDALASFYNRDYQRAISQFKSLVNTTSTELRDNSQYWIGECYYGLKQYSQALNAFEKVFNFKGTDKYDDAQLKLGYCYKQLNNNSRAVAEFERLIQYYPESEYRNIALNQISILD